METAQLCPPEILNSIASTRARLAEALQLPPTALAEAAAAAELTGALSFDPDLATAVLALPLLARPQPGAPQLETLIGAAAARTASDLSRFGEFGLARDWGPAQGLDARQAEAVRKMLLAVVSDPRLVLARLVTELVRLRGARHREPDERERMALAARAVFAPLANRLGVWQLKWELEDLAFRYLEPEAYHQIASALNEKRAARERYIDSLCETLRAELAAAGIAAEVYGRPKHIYSIHRKMERKQLPFQAIFDVRAVRIIVGSVRDCYAALGLVHGHWTYVASEFDDYIATPKDNQYRSIHTAIVGPAGAVVEVQIRTREMHEHAELGIAAHWHYKEGGTRNLGYERKIEAVRRLLRPGTAGEPERDFLERMREQLFEDRVYALTPKGEVVDLPRGSTPLDFAYHVHSDLGHRCRGAKVNGRIVPLTHRLANGEVVEIIAGKHPAPSRDWLAPELGYLASTRSRSKVRAWFRQQDSGDNRSAGRSIAERELTRAGAGPELLGSLLQALSARNTEELYQQLGEGAITATQLAQAIGRQLKRAAPGPKRAPRRSSAKRRSPVEVEGVGDLPITLARCCAPIRPQPIIGYATVGRGVTIHRRDCPSFARMQSVKPQRILQVDWTQGDSELLAVQLAVAAYDRRGLVRDLTDLITQERLSIEEMSTTTDRNAGTAHVAVRLAVRDLDQLARLTKRFKEVPNVLTVQRTG
ncbi:MAG TPA: bifunctional (p)ppGpp synthetase/guanosine-3',5'-bis(diphosphate) 3'-pyrophosphohydrolase [Steroidobacteraceae bacterium]|nr:bifunctional (p)ppGpp synthetase/guanosine-3',5'-bis(diphosphate) 3'-pyrophosphohydrolase [Steroidobacteraceae bacterium]